MYQNTTNEFNKKIITNGRTFRAKIICDNTEITDGIVSVSTKMLSGQDTQTLSIGSATSSQCDIVINSPEITFTGKEFELKIGLYLDEENIEWIPMGFYTAQEPTTYRGQVSFTSYDRMTSKLGGEYTSTLTYPCDIYDVCTEIESQTGIEILDKPNGITINKRVKSREEVSVDDAEDDAEETTEIITYCNPFDGYSYRDSVALISGLLGKFATFNRSGELEFRTFKDVRYIVSYLVDNNNNQLIDENMNKLIDLNDGIFVTTDRSFDDINISEEHYKLGYIECSLDEDVTLYSGSIGSVGISMTNHLMTQELLDSVFAEAEKLEYYPTTLSFMGDLRIDLGDIITIENYDGGLYSVPIMGLDYNFDGGLTCNASSYGNTEQSSSSYVSPTQVAIQKLDNDLYYIKKLIAKQITADRIDVDSLFAKDITATGTITGATLKGASGEFTKDFSVNVPVDECIDFILKASEKGLEFGIIASEEDYHYKMAEAYFSLTDGYLYQNAFQSMRFTVSQYSQGNMQFNVGNSEQMNISSYGVVIDKDFAVVGTSMFMDVYLNNAIYGTDGCKAIIGGVGSGPVYFGAASTNNQVTDTNVRGANVRLYAHSGGKVYLGSSGSTAVTSDENLKTLEDIENKYETFFENINPKVYQYKTLGNKTFHRKHLGFGARQVEEALNNAGLETKDFAGICIDKDVELPADEYGTDKDIHLDEMYSLRYEEFIALNTHMIQKQGERIAELENKLETQQKTIESLIERIEALTHSV